MGNVGSLNTLFLIAGAAVSLALLSAWLRPVAWGVALRDGAAALLASLTLLVVADAFWALAYPLDAPTRWRALGAAALLASPLAAALALRWRARRSIVRALLASGLALLVVVLWLTLHLRGPRGGWSATEGAATTFGAAVAVAFAACAGWWSKRAHG